MGEKDIISKRIFKRILVDVATYLFELELDSAELLETEQQRIEDRRADLCARVVDTHQNAFILHLEIQNQNQAIMPERMLRYFIDLRLQYPGEKIVQYLLYIGRKPLTMADGIVSEQLHYRYAVIDMHQKNYRNFLARSMPDAVVMAILCDFDGDEGQTVVHKLLRELIRLTDGNQQQLREYIEMLEILASNRDLNVDILEEYQMLQIEIEKLPSFMLGVEKGIEKGIEQGEKRRAFMVARRLWAKGMSLDDIADITGLEKSELERLK